MALPIKKMGLIYLTHLEQMGIIGEDLIEDIWEALGWVSLAPRYHLPEGSGYPNTLLCQSPKGVQKMLPQYKRGLIISGSHYCNSESDAIYRELGRSRRILSFRDSDTRDIFWAQYQRLQKAGKEKPQIFCVKKKDWDDFILNHWINRHISKAVKDRMNFSEKPYCYAVKRVNIKQHGKIHWLTK